MLTLIQAFITTKLFDVKSHKGVTMIEYVMLAAVIVTVAATAFGSLGTSLQTALGNITTYISGQMPS